MLPTNFKTLWHSVYALDSLLLRGISAWPCFFLRARRRKHARRHARPCDGLKAGLGLTQWSNRLSNGRAMSLFEPHKIITLFIFTGAVFSHAHKNICFVRILFLSSWVFSYFWSVMTFLMQTLFMRIFPRIKICVG